MIAGMPTPEDRQRITDLMREAFTADVGGDRTTAAALIEEALMPGPRHSLVVWRLCALAIRRAQAKNDQVLQLTVDVGTMDPDVAVSAARLVELFLAAHATDVTFAEAMYWDALETIETWMAATRLLFELTANVLSVDVPAGELPDFLRRLELDEEGGT